MKLKGIELNGTYTFKCDATGFEVYDEKDNVIYLENNNDYWAKWGRDEKSKRIYYENSGGHWSKSEYDKKGKRIYYEDSNSYWEKREYDEKGNEVYFENSDGKIIDARVRVIELTIEQIEKLLGYKIKIKGE